MIGIYYGNEPYLIQLEKCKYIKNIKNPEMNLIYSSVVTADIFGFLNTFPIMDERRLAVLDLDVLSQLDTADFREYMENPAESSDLFIMIRNPDLRTKFAKELGKRKLLHECKKLSDMNSVVNYILPVIKKAGGRITESAMKEFMTRENYLEATKVNLLNIINDLKGLLTIDKDITLAMVTTYIRSNEVENRFEIAKMIADHDLSRLRKQSDLITGTDSVIAVLSLVLWNYRIAWKSKVIDDFRAKYVVFNNMPLDTIYKGLEICQNAIDSVKQGAVPTDEILNITFMQLAMLT